MVRNLEELPVVIEGGDIFIADFFGINFVSGTMKRKRGSESRFMIRRKRWQRMSSKTEEAIISDFVNLFIQLNEQSSLPNIHFIN